MLGACRSSAPNVHTWGSMRAVMREGRTEARVRLADVLSSDRLVGVGALAGLAGEIAIVDGVAWIARVDSGQLQCDSDVRMEDHATLLATSDVEHWRELTLPRDVELVELEQFLAREARGTELERAPAWPFVVEGELANVATHVLNGACPFAAEVDAEHQPLRRSFESVDGILVGFFAPSAGGELVHHGQTTHVHLVVSRPAPYVGHVDHVALRAGARVRVPDVR